MKALLILLVSLSSPAFAALSFDSEVPQSTQVQFSKDVENANTLIVENASPLHKKVFGNDNTPYGKFFSDRVLYVGYDDNAGNAVAYVSPWYANKMFLTQNYVNFSHPQIARIMVFFHESRHTERSQGNWGHSYCPVPFLDKDGRDMKSIWTGSTLAGQPACDNVAIGAYGMSVIMLKNIAKSCANCSEKVKMDAALYSADQLNRLVNPEAVKQILADMN